MKGYSCGFALQKSKYKILNDLIWFKPNASPNLSCRYFTASHETLLWAIKDKKGKHTFNYEVLKDGDWGDVFYIIECKYQQVAGSVDEKLQTCDFKKKQYKKLLSTLNIEVEYIYILNDWFRNPAYKDVLDYIHSVGCDYYFNYIPLKRLGLPVSE